MKRKGQAAMEFLMTYGWAILVVLAAIGALAYFGVLSPQKLLPDRTTFTAPTPNIDLAVIDGTTGMVSIAFRNNVGVNINVTGGSASAGCNGPGTATLSSDSLNTNPISNGDTFIVEWSCATGAPYNIGDKFDADVTFDYINLETGQSRKATGSVQGKWS